MSNGFGTPVFFGMNNTSITFGITGSVISCKFSKEAEKKEAVDGNNAFTAVFWGKYKNTAALSIMLQSSASTFTLPAPGAKGTFAAPWSAEASGTWAVDGTPSVDFTKDDFAKVDLVITQWVTGNGTTIP